MEKIKIFCQITPKSSLHSTTLNFSKPRRIEFRALEDFAHVVHTYLITSQAPGCLAKASESTLLYSDCASDSSKVLWLDCSVIPPRPPPGRSVTHTDSVFIMDICFVQNGNKQLIVTTDNRGALCAYDVRKDRSEWVMSGDPGVHATDLSTDGCGHLFVGDFNNQCIQVFGTDGVYQRDIGVPWMNPFLTPYLQCWCRQTASFVIVHRKSKKWQLLSLKTDSSLTASVFYGSLTAILFLCLLVVALGLNYLYLFWF